MEKITCPNCNFKFDIENALASELQKDFNKKLQAEKATLIREQQAVLQKLSIEKNEFEEKKKIENEIFAKKLESATKQQTESIKKELADDFNNQIKLQEEELLKNKTKLQNLQNVELELLRAKKRLSDAEEDIKHKLQKEFFEKQTEIEEKGRRKERESALLREREFQKKLDDQKKLIEEMRRKSEQGSMQMQGEVQELALEELLRANYPFDIIKEVPKGVRGADSIQIVVNAAQQECGSIVYESKRTKHFTASWIEKLKQDQIACKADIAVLVTQAYPIGMNRFGEKDGVWICNFQEVKSLSFVLRHMLIKTNSVKLAQENKGDKMELLYNYLTSNEFIQNVKRIVENYDMMITQLNSEKKAMHKIWTMREKQIWVVQENIAALFGSIKGIAGNALPSIEHLELPFSNDE